MSTNPYPAETFAEDDYDSDPRERMPENVGELAEVVVGHHIVSVDKGVEIPRPTDRYYYGHNTGTAITLNNGKRVFLVDTGDCCAYTELETFLLHADKIDHIIMGVGTTEGFTRWHIYADMGDVLELTVGWSGGNGYYAYGFDILVVDPEATS